VDDADPPVIGQVVHQPAPDLVEIGQFAWIVAWRGGGVAFEL
jgi:hypothetical protein